LRLSILQSGLKLVLGGIERGPRLADLFELQDGLDLIRTLRGLDQDEAQNFAAGQRDLGMVRDLFERGLDVGIGRNNLRLPWRRDFPCDGRRLAERRDEDL
jgi:hypothetical protein